MDIETALELVDDDLPDGAWMAVLCEMTDMDAGEVSAELYALEERRRTEEGQTCRQQDEEHGI